MKQLSLYAAILGAFSWSTVCAQEIPHSDVFFSYGETKIEILNDSLVLPQLMLDSGFFRQANGNPGFFNERDNGGGTGPSDIVGYNVLDDLLFWSEGDFATPRETTEIRIINNPRTVADTIIGTDTGEQRAMFDPLRNTIGQSNSAGDFHSHVDFRLDPISSDPEESPLPGAYGLKLSLSSANSDIEESDPFFIVYRFGIEPDDFAMALEDFSALLSPATAMTGDFDVDGFLTAVDIDLLSAEVAAQSNDLSFDLTGDAVVDQADRLKWIEELAGTISGDANLDGTVQFSDFLALSGGFGMPGGWADGDFDGDGDVQFADFLSLSANFGQMGAAAASVPEPASGPLAVIALATLSLARRRSRTLTPREWSN